jgi:hypothetical protein
MVALAPLIPTAIAILGTLLAIGIWIVARFFNKLLSFLNLRVPVVGWSIPIGNWISAAINPLTDTAVNLTRGHWVHLQRWVYGHGWTIQQVSHNTVIAVRHVGDQIAHLHNTEIPAARRDAAAEAGRAVHSLERTIGLDAHKAAADLQRALSATDRAIYHREQGIESLLEHGIKSAAASAVDAANDYTDIQIGRLRIELQTFERTLPTVVGDDVNDALDGIRANLANALLGRAVATTSEGLLALAVAAPILAVAARVTSIERCDPVCTNPVSPNYLNKLLKDLGLLAELTGIGAFLTEVINNPAAAANAYSTLIAGTEQAGQTALDALLSL